jgi:uncharacterized protein GlcG (DUF336 family)
VVAACGRQGYHETAVVLDADGATIAALRGDGAGIHTLDSAHDKAYTAVTFRNDTLALAERAKGEDSIAPLAKLPHDSRKRGLLPVRARSGTRTW